MAVEGTRLFLFEARRRKGAENTMVDLAHIFRRYAEVVLFGVLAIAFEVFVLVFYSVWLSYSRDPAQATSTVADPNVGSVTGMPLYPFFRDVNIMIFFGFGFLMAYLRRYGYSAICYSILIAG